jgi:hypothetical protein
MYSNHFYVANDFGVYRTTDGGTNWTREGLNFPWVPAMDFDYAVSNGVRYLRVGTHGRSAFETDLDFIVPVELISFTANANKGDIELKWTTATELNNSGFEIERASFSTTPGQEEWEIIGFVPGFGTTTEPKEYSYTDENISGFLKYRLKQVDYDGSYEYSTIIEIQSSAYLTFELNQNYPNPFNPITNISYTLPSESYVKLNVFNSIGEKIQMLVSEFQTEGRYEAIWNAENYSSGVYYYTIEVMPVNGNQPFGESRKMILLK